MFEILEIAQMTPPANHAIQEIKQLMKPPQQIHGKKTTGTDNS